MDASAIFAPDSAALGLAKFQAAFDDYLQWNTRDQGFLIEDRGQKVRLALLAEFRDRSPSPEELRAEVSALGYAIHRRKNRAGRRLTPDQEISARLRSRRFLAASFVLKDWRRLKDGEGQSGRFVARTRAQTEIGNALVRTASGETSPRVSLTSFLEGAVAQAREHQILSRVLSAQADDMAVYAARKHREYLARNFAQTTDISISV